MPENAKTARDSISLVQSRYIGITLPSLVQSREVRDPSTSQTLREFKITHTGQIALVIISAHFIAKYFALQSLNRRISTAFWPLGCCKGFKVV